MEISKVVKDQIQIARIIMMGLMAGQIFFYIFVWMFIRKSAVLFNPDFANSFLYMALPFAVFGTFLLGIYIGKKRKLKLQKNLSEQRKAEFYRETVILQAALVEGGSLYSIFVAFFTFSYLPFLFFAAGLLMFLYFLPSGEKYNRYLKSG